MYIRVPLLLSFLALTVVGCYAASARAGSPPDAPASAGEPWSTVLADARIDLPCSSPGLNAGYATLGRGTAYVVDGCGMRVVYAASMWVTGSGSRPEVILLSRLPIPPSGTLPPPHG